MGTYILVVSDLHGGCDGGCLVEERTSGERIRLLGGLVFFFRPLVKPSIEYSWQRIAA